MLNIASHSYFRMGYNAFKIYSKKTKPTLFDSFSVNKTPISSFSASSRKNMLFKLQLLDYSLLSKNNYQSLFVTLTYQDKLFNNYKDMADVKRDIDTLYKRLARHLGKNNFFFFYKLEFTKKGIPHFHLFFVSKKQNNNKEYINMRVWFSENWSDVITKGLSVPNDDLTKIRLASTNVRFIKTSNQGAVFSYMNKEISKTVQTEVSFFVGRFWGIKGRNFYSFCILDVVFTFTDKYHFFKFRRSVFKYLKSKGLNISAYKQSLLYNHLSGLTAFYIKDIRYFLNLYLYFAPPDNSL